MHIDKHDLHSEFPEFNNRIHELKVAGGHFGTLFTKYDELTHEIHNFETGAKNTTDEVLEEMKKSRLLLKDELYALLKAE